MKNQSKAMTTQPQPSAIGEAAQMPTLTTPWFVGSPIRSTDTLGICVKWQDGEETGEETIAEVLPAIGKVQAEQAAFIVTACNSYAANQARIKALEEVLIKYHEMMPTPESTAALALGKKE